MLLKTLSLADCEIKQDSNTGRFSGYASTFGRMDMQGDTIIKGAYAETLRNHGLPKMLIQHDRGALPIGKWLSAKEDDHGLLVEGELTPGMARAEEARAALRHGTIDGLSIGYMLRKGDYEDTPNGRVIRRVNRLVEISIVAFPADSAARIDMASVKLEEIEQIESVREMEHFFRDSMRFDQATAKRLVSRLRDLLTDDANSSAAERFERLASGISAMIQPTKKFH